MEEIKSGVLSGVKISEASEELVGKVADKIKELDNGVLDPEEKALGDLMGAGASVEDEIKEGADIVTGEGSQIAEHGLLTGVDISENQSEIQKEVAEIIEEVEEFEAGAANEAGIESISETLAVAMGVESEQ